MSTPYSQAYSVYEAKQKANTQKQIEAENARLDYQIAALEAQKKDIGVQYDDASRQAYAQGAVAQRNLSDVLAAQGITGGAYETRHANLANTTASNAAEIYRQRLAALGNVDQSINDARAQAQQNIYGYQINSDSALADAYLKATQNDINYQYQQERDRVADERYAAELAYQKERDRISDEQTAAQLAYQQAQQELANKRYEEELAYQREQDTLAANRTAAADEYEKALMRWQATGKVSDKDAAVLGLSAGTVYPSASTETTVTPKTANEAVEDALSGYIKGTADWYSALESAVGADAARSYIQYTLKNSDLLDGYDKWKAAAGTAPAENDGGSQKRWEVMLYNAAQQYSKFFDENANMRTRASVERIVNDLVRKGMPEEYAEELYSYFDFN